MTITTKGICKVGKKILAAIAAISVLAGLVFGVNAYETKFATAEDIKQIREDIELLAERLENKILEDKVHDLQRRLWSLEDRYGGRLVPKASQEVLDSYRELTYSLELAKKGIKGGMNP